MERLIRVTEAEWLKLRALLPGPAKTGRPRASDRMIIEGIIWVMRTGAPWRDLPEAYPPWQTVYERFSSWCRGEVLGRMFSELALEMDGEGFSVDATIVRAHQDPSGAPNAGGHEQIGRSRGGPTTKVHAVVDALGNPVRLMLTVGQAHEMTVASELLSETSNAYVVADSAYSSASLLAELERRGCQPVIGNNPTHRRRQLDTHLYRERFLVELFFQKLKRHRRLAMRFEKLARNFLGFVQLACALMWLA
jgi:transposase